MKSTPVTHPPHLLSTHFISAHLPTLHTSDQKKTTQRKQKKNMKEKRKLPKKLSGSLMKKNHQFFPASHEEIALYSTFESKKKIEKARTHKRNINLLKQKRENNVCHTRCCLRSTVYIKLQQPYIRESM